MTRKRSQLQSSDDAGTVPADEFGDDGQDTHVWTESATHPVHGAGNPPPASTDLAFDGDDFDDDVPTMVAPGVERTGEVPIRPSGLPKPGASALPPPASAALLTIDDDYEDDVPTSLRHDPEPEEDKDEHTQLLGDEELEQLAFDDGSVGVDGSIDTAGLVGHTFGAFKVMRKIAEGGMASVYLGRKSGPAGFAQHAALKLVHPHFAHQQAFVDMFLDEARIAARINHPSVCRVLDFGQSEATYYLAMEYVHGESWADVITSMLADSEALRHVPAVTAYVIAQACEGLYAAHQSTDEQGRLLQIVHRDISPQNIFVAYDGTVRVLDFGIASAADRVSTTRTGAVKGRLAYMAPEQMRGAEVDRRADIWSLGVLLREALEGRRLFRRRTDAESMLAVVQQPLPAWTLGVPDPLRAVADRALSHDRTQRFDNCRDMGRALNQYLTSEGVALSPADVSGIVSRLFADRMLAKNRWLRQVAPASRPEVETAELAGDSGGLSLDSDSADLAPLGQSPEPAPVAAPPTVSAPPPVVRDPDSVTPTDITAAPPGLFEALEADSPEGADVPTAGRYVPTMKMEAVPAPQRPRSRRGLWIALAVVAVLAALGVVAQREGFIDGLGTKPAQPAPPPAIEPPPAAVATGPATLAVEVEDGWADVYVGGELLGKTPLQHELPPGEVEVELRVGGQEPGAKQTLKLHPGQTLKLRMRAPDAPAP